MTIMEIIAAAEQHLQQSGGQEAAVQVYQNWLYIHGHEQQAAPIWFNLGVIQSNLGDKPATLSSYLKARELMPTLWQASGNLGNYYELAGEIDQAITVYEQALEYPMPVEGATFIRNQLGRLFEGKRQFKQAGEQYFQSLCLDQSQKDAFQHWFYLKQKQCDWPLDAFPKPSSAREIASSMGTLSAMAYFDDVELLSLACNEWVKRYKKNKSFYHLVEKNKKYQHKKIKVGYVSCDFRMHAVSFLSARIYELHDREQFEVFGFDYSIDEQSVWRKRILDGMDHVFPIHDLSDEEAAKLIQSQEIDILFDMVGLTSGGRPGIFMYRPAPIQVHYLGFLGPVGIEEVDYMVCDEYVVPPPLAPFYGAKPIYLPFYQINNNLRQYTPKPERSALGLPEDAFVFCSIINSYKVNPSIFHHWMQILQRTSNSVLWLLEENDSVKANLLREIRKYDIDESRIIFAKPVDPRDYLSRFQCADLFLDTSPYNAGITGSDAIWMGLPLLTCPGNTYVSRMAASLLNQLGLQDFICQDWNEYVNKAVQFCESRTGAREIFDRIFDRNHPIFSSEVFVKNLETALLQISQERDKA